MASTAQELNFDNVKYYDININTISPDCYPLQCALLTEMLYFTGTYPLYHSTLNSNDVFKNTFISHSDKKTYSKIESSFDKILNLEDDLYYYYIELSNASHPGDVKLLNKLIAHTKDLIKKVFFDTQNLIIQSCFTTAFNKISTIEDVKEFQTKLYNFKDVLCYTENYNFYNEFYRNTMLALESIREIIEANGNMVTYRIENVSLALIDNTPHIFDLFKRVVQKIKKLFYLNKAHIEEIKLEKW